MIVGVGVDAIEISRIRLALQRTPSLQGRVFTQRERAFCTTSCGDLRYGGLAARFAAKEAVAKALGTGLRGFGFRDVEVTTDELGRPEVTLHNGAADVASKLGVARIHLSLSTATDMAVAHAVAETA